MKNHLWATRTWLARHRRTVAWRVKTLKRFLIIGCEVVNYHLQGFCDVPYTWLKLCAFDECSQDSFRFEHHGIEQGLRCRGGALLLEREFLVFTRIPWTGRNVRRLHFKAPTMCLRSKTSGSRFCRTQAKMTCTKCSVEQYDATLKILDWFSFELNSSRLEGSPSGLVYIERMKRYLTLCIMVLCAWVTCSIISM